MAELVDDFLNETSSQISDLDICQTVLEKNPDQEDCWDALYRFFDFVRSVAPFAGFMRLYRLADVAIEEIKEYRISGKSFDILSSVFAKYRRVCEILAAAERLKREPRESDDDILPVRNAINESASQPFLPSGSSVHLPDVSDQETALDKREEELILWSQMLTEQENILKRKENILFKEENSQEIAQEKINEVLKRLNEQEKIQRDLEECLAETRLDLDACQKKLADQELLRTQSENLLQAKEQSLNEISRKVVDMRQQIEKQKALAELREDELTNELQERLRQNEELQIRLQSLEYASSDMDKDRNRIFSEYSHLEEEYKKVLLCLENEKEEKTQLIKEKRELEKQHLEFSSRIIDLQENLVVEKENIKRTEYLLKEQEFSNNIINSELKAAGWPYDALKYQKELALLSERKEDGKAVDSLLVMKDLIRQIRTRSLAGLSRYFTEIVQAATQQYQRVCEMAIDCGVSGGMDVDAKAVLEQLLFQLTDNAFRYAVPPKGEKLSLSFSIREDGVFLRGRFSDNGCAFDFDRLHNTVQAAGLIDKSVSLSRPELLSYLFHNTVKRGTSGSGGLFSVLYLLEQTGGQISVDFDKGLQVEFAIPKHFLYDKALLFSLSGQLLALPLTAVAETVVLKEGDIIRDEKKKSAFFYWKGDSLPVLDSGDADRNFFGIVVLAGVFKFLMPVERILDTEFLISFESRTAKEENSFVPCTVLESGRKPLWLNIAALIESTALPLSRKILSFEEDVKPVENTKVSYLIYKAEPNILGAVSVNSVLRVEDFVLSSDKSLRKKVWETEGKKLPLKDACRREGYPHAQAVLIFEKSALAIYEVADIIDIPNTDPQNENTDFIVYSGRKVPVLKVDD